MAQRTIAPDDEHNAALLDLVHPSDWTNPTPGGRYNLVVIGGGAAGLVTAIGGAGLGAKVALIEADLMGGDCLNWGCVPSKALLASAKRAYHAHQDGHRGITSGPAVVDFSAVMTHMRSLRSHIAHHDAFSRVRDAGVDTYLGHARFASPTTIAVGEQVLHFSRAVIATGAKAWIPPIEGIESVHVLTNETLFQLTKRPEHLLVVGAGPVGCEMAQAFRRLGAEVTLIDQAPTILPNEDPEAAQILQQQLRSEGIRMQLGARIERLSQHGEQRKHIHLQSGEQVVGDAILMATGRRANIDRLGLDAANVAVDRRGVVTKPNLQSTTNPRVFAAGDVTGRDQFTHAADEMARIVLQNALFFGRRRYTDVALPRATYTDPPVAHIGLTATEANERPDVMAYTAQFSDVDRTILEGETTGFVRLYSSRRGQLLGATIVGADADNLIGMLSMAMTAKVSMSALAGTIHPYPTASDAIRRAAAQWNKQRLTPTRANVLRQLMRFRR